MGVLIPVIPRVYLSGKYWYSDEIVVCYKHKRYMPLQPVTTIDKEASWQCPFCPGGKLQGKYHTVRSIKKWDKMLGKLSRMFREANDES